MTVIRITFTHFQLNLKFSRSSLAIINDTIPPTNLKNKPKHTVQNKSSYLSSLDK